MAWKEGDYMLGVHEWLNENFYRAYPLQNEGARGFLTTLSLDRTILDAQLIYAEATDINLSAIPFEAIVVTGQQLEFVVTGQEPFIITDRLTEVYPAYLTNAAGSLLVVGEEARQITASVTFSDVMFEPAVVVDLSGVRGLSSIVANGVETAGAITFSEGYQFGLSSSGQTIRMKADQSSGRPITCQDYFTGLADDCGAIISCINGVTTQSSPGIFTLKAGPHVKIFDDPTNHRIYIGVDFQNSDVCRPPKRPSATVK